MIDIRQLTDEDIGRYVLYTDGVGNKDMGRLKSWNHKWVFVVYNCDDKWDDYSNYTAAATDPNDIEWKA